MRRLAATCALDIRLQFRSGFYAATLVALASSVVLMRQLTTTTAEQILPAVILGNVAINTFYFVGGLLLLERTDGTLLAQELTPLRTSEYIAAKVGTLTLLSIIENSLLLLGVLGSAIPLARAAIGVTLTGTLFSLAGLLAVSRYTSINEFLLPSIPIVSALCLPALAPFGLGSQNWYWLHPIQGPLTLMQADIADPAGTTIFSVVYGLFWITPMWHWSHRALKWSCAA